MKEASCGAIAQAWDCKRDRLWVRFPLEEMKHLIFSLSLSGRGKCGVEFPHLTYNART